MIESLHIRDYALIDALDVSFGPGLTVLTGQTGAGKSIVIGALSLVLGERADTESIRSGAAKAVAELQVRIPDDPELTRLLDDAGIERAGHLILRREVRESGSRAFINDTPVTVGILKQVGDRLVDLHGQHDHQLLLNEEEHRRVIDGLPEVAPKAAAYRSAWAGWLESKRALDELIRRENDIRQKMELWRFQLTELEGARLDAEEMEGLEAEMRLLDSAEELDQRAGLLVALGMDAEVNADDLLARMETALQDLAAIDAGFQPFSEEFTAARISIREAVRHAERYRAGIEFNPKRLEQLRSRQAELRRLEKKYARTLPELVAWQEELRREIALADNLDLERETRQEAVRAAAARLEAAGQDLDRARAAAGRPLADALVAALADMGIGHAAFIVDVGKRAQPADSGVSDVRFLLSTNRGETPKPLARTASGGEISRVMLALKSVLAREQRLPVMIFDEIDTGISGAVAEKVGRTMRDLASSCQIIAITHQPQIASQAHHHIVVEKAEHEGRTLTRLRPLDEEDHIREVAVLMSGETVSEAALTSARQLIGRARAH